MDRDILLRKLDSLARCVGRIEQKRPATLQSLLTDIDLQDILSINLERAVQLSVDLGAHIIADRDSPPPATMGDVFEILSAHNLIPAEVATALRRAVGFRNLSVHAYDRVDWERVFDIVHERLDDFRVFAAAIARILESRI